MIKQIFMPLTMGISQEMSFLAQHDPRARADLDQFRATIQADIAEKESQLNDALNAGFNIVSATVITEHNGQSLHYLLHKPEAT